MSVASMLRNLCSINRPGQGRGSAGELSSSVSTAATGVRVMLDVTSDEPDIGDKEKPVIRGQAYFAYGTDIRAGDYITMSDGQHSGLSFAIKGAPTDDVGRQTHLVADVVHNTGGPIR